MAFFFSPAFWRGFAILARGAMTDRGKLCLRITQCQTFILIMYRMSGENTCLLMIQGRVSGSKSIQYQQHPQKQKPLSTRDFVFYPPSKLHL
ncbi:hypothetical protein B9Z19DRAFT_228944 [Tuber borchii]|uniref:Secreted protein n=1 Tax=Tuber borchii TaxID=42251 RepID=A0A2T6ZMI8_TUBBO|nr:hypothetical protein B9Z19DRAFT_228944 [Tuber borchii]